MISVRQIKEKQLYSNEYEEMMIRDAEHKISEIARYVEEDFTEKYPNTKIISFVFVQRTKDFLYHINGRIITLVEKSDIDPTTFCSLYSDVKYSFAADNRREMSVDSFCSVEGEAKNRMLSRYQINKSCLGAFFLSESEEAFCETHHVFTFSICELLEEFIDCLL